MTAVRFSGSRSARPSLADSSVLEPQQLAYALPSQHLNRAFSLYRFAPTVPPVVNELCARPEAESLGSATPCRARAVPLPGRLPGTLLPQPRPPRITSQP